jgi:hypothetical protein
MPKGCENRLPHVAQRIPHPDFATRNVNFHFVHTYEAFGPYSRFRNKSLMHGVKIVSWLQRLLS